VRPRSGALLLPLFAAILGAWWVVLLAWDTDPLPTALLGGAAAACLLTGLALGVRRRVRPAVDVRAAPDTSLGAPVLAAGVAGLVLGAGLGAWLLLVAGGLVVLGGALLAREWRDARRAVRATREERAP
jgi:hypothetical protein